MVISRHTKRPKQPKIGVRPRCETCIHWVKGRMAGEFSEDWFEIVFYDGMCSFLPEQIPRKEHEYCSKHQDFDAWFLTLKG